MVLWRPIRPFRTNTQKRCHFHYRGLEYKSRKSRNTWSNRQIWPWSMEWSRAKTNRVLPRERTVIATTPFQQYKRRPYTWTSPDGQHWNQIKYILCSQRWRRRQWHPTLVLLPGKSRGWQSLVGYSPWGRWESDTTERLPFHFSLSCIVEGNGNPLQCSCLEKPSDGKPGGLLSMWSHRVGHDWSDLAAAYLPLLYVLYVYFISTTNWWNRH